jgi:aspartyl-tRNA(Asn)/glutamyl-tRNA(Gln) amidotransferase subunit C
MTERITKETFDHLVKLAELELSPDEAEYLRRELNNQLGAIAQLQAIPLDEDIPISLHGVTYTLEERQQLREDVWSPFEDVDAILSQVPELVDDQITVPEIPHKTLE